MIAPGGYSELWETFAIVESSGVAVDDLGARLLALDSKIEALQVEHEKIKRLFATRLVPQSTPRQIAAKDLS